MHGDGEQVAPYEGQHGERDGAAAIDDRKVRGRHGQDVAEQVAQQVDPEGAHQAKRDEADGECRVRHDA